MPAKQAINDKLRGNVATHLRCGGVINNQIKEGLLASLSEKKIKSVCVVGCGQDEYGTAAYKTVELDTFLDDQAVQHRECEGHESDLFLSYFPKGLT